MIRALSNACPDRAMGGWGRRLRIAIAGRDLGLPDPERFLGGRRRLNADAAVACDLGMTGVLAPLFAVGSPPWACCGPIFASGCRAA